MTRTIYLTQDDGVLGRNGEGFSWRRNRKEPAEKIPNRALQGESSVGIEEGRTVRLFNVVFIAY